jgi:hypothetical protein
MCGCSERNFECADALVAEARAIASASVARSVAAGRGEYPVVVWAPSGAASAKTSESARCLFISR